MTKVRQLTTMLGKYGTSMGDIVDVTPYEAERWSAAGAVELVEQEVEKPPTTANTPRRKPAPAGKK